VGFDALVFSQKRPWFFTLKIIPLQFQAMERAPIDKDTSAIPTSPPYIPHPNTSLLNLGEYPHFRY
jgi:hypothetical protein